MGFTLLFAAAGFGNAKNITSISSNGSSIVMVEFNDGTDMDMAMLDMREKIDMIKVICQKMPMSLLFWN